MGSPLKLPTIVIHYNISAPDRRPEWQVNQYCPTESWKTRELTIDTRSCRPGARLWRYQLGKRQFAG
jgi:hypothetical protein